MIASVHHAACETPRNSELHAVAAADKAARELAAKKAAAFDAMIAALRRVSVANSTDDLHLRAAVDAAIAQAEEVAS
jgi:hypothetical protein